MRTHHQLVDAADWERKRRTRSDTLDQELIADKNKRTTGVYVDYEVTSFYFK